MLFVNSKIDNIGQAYRGKSVLITGASGFIGSHLTRTLLGNGAIVTVLVRYLSEIRNVRLNSIWRELHIIEGDLRNQDSLTQLNKLNFDVVFHLAAYNHVGQSFLNVSEVFDVNAKGTANLLEACREFGRLVYTSTSEVYGKQSSVPFVESMQPCPISPYAITKYSGELYCRMKREMGSLPIVIIRPFNAFGPYQSAKAIIPELIIKCIQGDLIETTEGRQTREFNYIDNVIDGFLRCGLVEGIEGEVINVAEGHEISVRDLTTTIHHLTGSASELHIGAVPYRPTEIWRMFADASKARQLLGWKVSIPFEQGLALTVDWFHEYLNTFGNIDSALNRL